MVNMNPAYNKSSLIFYGLRLFCLLSMTLVLASCGKNDAHIALGTLERERILLSAIESQIVKNIYVNEGDNVKKGQRLVKLDDTTALLKVEQAKAELVQAQAELTKLQNGARDEDVAAAKARLVSAKANLIYQKKMYQRIIKLREDNSASQSDLDKVKSSYDAAQAQYNDESEQLRKLTNGTRPEDILKASANVDASKIKLKIAQQVVDQLNITATRDGRVESLPWNLGERVSLGAPVVVLLSGDAPLVRTFIPESYRINIKSGDKVSLRIDGLKKPLKGVISKIATQSSFTPYYGLTAENRSRLVYLAEIKVIDKDAANLPTGLPVEVILP
jgi:HlyD family secretion protein